MTKADAGAESDAAHPRRDDIDGVRAIAVVLVLLFHLGWSALPGGFVGVDVFFVISGFLISNILRRQFEQRKFDYLGFLARRAFRILPALFVMVFVTWLVGRGLFPDMDAAALWSFLGLANLHYWAEADYFAASAFQRPLLHMWSLGVEMQFYLLWPVFLLFLFGVLRMSRPKAAWAVFVAMLIGLGFAIDATGSSPEDAFYLPNLRAWEFAIGALVAFWTDELRVRPKLAETIRAISLVTLLGSAVWLGRGQAFPGLSALVPCLATAGLLVPLSSRTLVSNILASPIPRWLGKISYSLYLWHWPVILIYLETTSRSTPGATGALFCIAVSLGLAELSRRWIEDPIRGWRPEHAGKMVAGGSVLALMGTGGLAWITTTDLSPRSKELEAIFHTRMMAALSAERPDIVFVGDSSCMTGINPEIIAEATDHASVLSLCLFGSVGPLGNARALDLLGQSGQSPEHIVVMIHPTQFSRGDVAEAWVDYITDWTQDNVVFDGETVSGPFAARYPTIGDMTGDLREFGFLVDPNDGPTPMQISPAPLAPFEDRVAPLKTALAGFPEARVYVVVSPTPESFGAQTAPSAADAVARALGLTPNHVVRTEPMLPDSLFATFTHVNESGIPILSSMVGQALAEAMADVDDP